MTTTDVSQGEPGTAEPIVRFEQDDRGFGWFVAYQPDLPGCMAQGDTEAEAVSSLQEARELCLTAIRDHGLTVRSDRDWPPTLE